MNYTQLFIENQEVDLTGVDKLSLIFAINDFRELRTRDSNHSRTIELPGTKKNHQAFGFSFQLNGRGSFDTSKLAKALLLVNGHINMEGYCRLMDCVTEKGVEKYIINLYGGNQDWISLIGDAELTDLDLSEYNHDWTAADIISAFGNTEGYTYSLIDYGRFGNLDTIDDLLVTDFYPEVFIHTLLRKIYDRIGYTITGSFVADPQHNALTIPFANKDFEHNLQWKEEREFTATRSFYTSLIDVNEKIIWDSSTGTWIGNEFTATEATKLTLKIKGEADVWPLTRIELQAWKNGDASTTPLGEFLGVIASIPAPGGSGMVTKTIEGSLTVDLNKNDVLQVNIGIYDYTGTIRDLELTSDVSRLLIPGGDVRLSDNLPKMKQIDLIITLFKMFGLIFQPDLNTKTIQIDAFKDFYKKPDPLNADSFVDWSDKLDLSQNINREFIVVDYGRNNLFQWKQDQDDSDIMEYMRTRGFPFNTGFGNGSHDIKNDFLKQKEVIADLPFASTWMKDSFNGFLHLPSIKKYIDSEYKGTPEPRILIRAGAISVAALTQNPNLDTITIDGNQVTEIGYSYFWKKYYPGAASPGINSLDLNLYFDNEAVQFGTTLMNKYYSELLPIITKGRIITCCATLNEIDINSLDFGKPVYISYFSSYFILNKIEDYYANQNHESSFIELIPID